METRQDNSNEPSVDIRAFRAVRTEDNCVSIELNSSLDDENVFYVRWNNLSYTVEPKLYERILGKSSKRILNGLNGFFLSGELIALMGPSGAGKTTLLECLCMKKSEKEMSGSLTVVGKPKIRIAVVPQYDDFLPQFTVTETIFYASRYKNLNHDISHRNIVKRVIHQLGLEVCQNNSISRCSGGQRKRVAIAQELVKRPNILLLDEPTSGLDSSSCYQTIKVLKNIISSSIGKFPLAIVTTIHQPSAKVMDLFDRVYLMAAGGRLAFNDLPSAILPALESVDCPCPPFYNPIDHMIEVVSGDYGSGKVEKLVSVQRKKKVNFDSKLESISSNSLRKAILYDPCPVFSHLWIHFQRSTIQLVKDPILFGLRISLHFVMAFFYASLWGREVGKGAGCPTLNKQSFSSIGTALSGNLTAEEIEDVNRINDNQIFTIYGGMFTMYAAAMIAVLTFPLDVKVLCKEYFNGWYTVPTYLTGKIAADFPFQVFSVAVFTSISYHITNQPSSDYHWRFAVYMYSLMILSMIAQTQGLLVGAIFMKNLSASVFVGPLTITPVFLFSGFARRYQRTSKSLKPFIKLSYFHHAVKTIYGALYGFSRCKCNPDDYRRNLDDFEYEDISSISRNSGLSYDTTDTNSEKTIYIGKFKCDDSFQSLVMTELEIEDDEVWLGMAVMFGYLVVLRLLVLILVQLKVSRH